jgi:ribosomal protein S18 acetylase RimI-like enzyme
MPLRHKTNRKVQNTMTPSITIERLTAEQAQHDLPQLVMLLQDAVASGASVGFLHPLSDADAAAYLQGVIADVAQGSRYLLVARQNGDIIGMVQLALETKVNGLHRAEIQKLMVLRSARNQGIGRQLMECSEAQAGAQGRTLLVLDTRQGDSAEQLYRKMGYTEAGVIPKFAVSSQGTLDATVIFYKLLTPRS